MFYSQSGNTLIEVLLALAIFAFAIVGVLHCQVQNYKLIHAAKQLSQVESILLDIEAQCLWYPCSQVVTDTQRRVQNSLPSVRLSYFSHHLHLSFQNQDGMELHFDKRVSS